VEQLFVVTHPEPVQLEARELDQEGTPEGSIALGYYHDGAVLARGIVATDALEAIHSLLESPVSLALAATEDEEGNINARVCLVLPMDPDEARAREEGEEPEEPWKQSVPAPPVEVESGYGRSEEEGEGRPRLALLPIGNVVRGARNRNHEDVVSDAREMLDNLLAGRAQDAVSKAIDDLLDSL
jgi:hypothetical protein